MQQDKKIVERHILDLFRKNFREFPKGKIIPAESPDFIVRMSPKASIGIELVSFSPSGHKVGHATDFQSITTNIHQIISNKNDKLKIYRKKRADEYWLIVHSDSLQTGSFNLYNQLLNHRYSYDFQRVFLFDLFEGKIMEL